MGKKTIEKTIAMRIVEQARLPYEARLVGSDEPLSAVEVANRLGIDADSVFKTLVVEGKSGEDYAFLVPGPATLDLKKAAAAVGEKSVAMLPQKELKPHTGYVHGGCSPLGMKKALVTVIDETAQLYDEISFSAGKIGVQIRMNPEALASLIDARFVDICAENAG